MLVTISNMYNWKLTCQFCQKTIFLLSTSYKANIHINDLVIVHINKSRMFLLQINSKLFLASDNSVVLEWFKMGTLVVNFA